MDISQAGVSFTAQFEGLAQVNQNDGLVYPYADPVGLPTIGYGSRTDINGNPVTMNTVPITQDQALQLLNTVLEQFVAAVNNMVTVQLTQNQFDALVDFAYNVGAANLQSSTLLRMVNAGNFAGAAGQFIRWNKATSHGQLVVLPGLTRRRNAESQLFSTPDAN